jgi:Transglutaminase-like superfamily
MEIRHVLSVFSAFAVIVCLTYCASAGASADPNETEYFAVFMEGKKVGHTIQTRVVSDGKVTTSQALSITVSRLGVSITMDANETSIETTSGKPLGFEVDQKLGLMAMKIVGQIDKQGKASVTTTSMGTVQKSTFQWPEAAVMAEGLRLLTLKKGLDEGALYFAKIFEPTMQQALHAQIRIGPKQNVDLLGRVVNARKITTTLNMPETGDVISTSYIDDDLRVLKDVTPIAGIQVEMVACAKEFALSKNDAVELIDKMFLASPEPLEDPGSAKSITYYLAPTGDVPDVIIPSSDNQKVQQFKDGRAIVTVQPVTAPSGVRFPYKGPNKAIQEATKPTRFLQSNEKQVVALARRAVGDTTDAAEAARKIEAFVANYIQNRTLSVGYASAAEVAASRQGDCSEFAVLTAAMCRAVGIPAQVVVGVAYVNDFGGHQGFGGHAWDRAYIGDRWVGLDSAFRSSGRGGYDAGHIALAAGDGEPGDFFNLAATLGQFKIEKVVVKK